MIVRTASLSIIVLAVSLDVMPSCGERRYPRPLPPVYPCSAVCQAPTKCAELVKWTNSPREETYLCTKVCAADSDCASLGANWTCSRQGNISGTDGPREQICAVPDSVVDASTGIGTNPK